MRRRGGNRSGRSKVKRYGMSGASRTAGIAELAYGVLFGLVGIAATAKILMDDRSASRELKLGPAGPCDSLSVGRLCGWVCDEHSAG